MRDWVTLGSYQYDPFGRRVKKVTSAGAVYFHYDDTGLLAEYDASGQLISEYQYQPGNHWMTHPLFKRDGATGKVHYYYNSHLGQPLKLFDKAGRTTWSARSQAFGQTDVVVNETDNPLRFPGQYEDGETGLYYNYHRYYDSETGRYLRSDPAGLLAGVSLSPHHGYELAVGAAYKKTTGVYLNQLYAYAKNNSLGFYDPTGECPPCAPAAIGAVVGGIANVVATIASGDTDPANLAIAFGVGAVVGAAFGATGSVGGSMAKWVGRNAAAGALTGGATTYLQTGCAKRALIVGALGGALGGWAGKAGWFIASRNAAEGLRGLGMRAIERMTRSDALGSAAGSMAAAVAGGVMTRDPY